MARSAPRIALLPATLRARLTVTIVLASVLLFVLVYGVTMLATMGQTRLLARQSGLDHLKATHMQLALEARVLESHLYGFTDWQEFYTRSLDPTEEFIAAELDPWLRDKSGATVVVWMDAEGTTLFRHGTTEEVALISRLAVSDADGALRGPVGFPSGPHMLAIRPIIGARAAAPVGYLAVAKPITPSMLAGAEPGVVTTITSLPTTGPEGWDTLEAPPGFLSASVNIADSRIDVAGELLGVDGFPVGEVQIMSPNAWYQSSDGLMKYVIPLSLALASMLLGLGLGMLLGKLISKPIEEYVDYMRNQGYLAIEGLPLRESLYVDPALPDEFRDLATVIQDLLVQLGERQSELKHANELTVTAEQAFRTVVNDSSEVKMLVRAGIVDIANPAAAACLGKPLGMVLKQSVHELLGEMNMRLEDGEPLNADSLFEAALDRPTLVRCDGEGNEERWMKVIITESSPAGTFLLSARNVTEEHRLEALRAEIISLVSHDLRAPLTVVSGYLELLARPLADEDRAKAAEAAKLAAGRMSTLLAELLETTRAEQVFAPSSFTKIPLGALSDEIAEAMRMSSGREIVVVKRRKAVVLGDGLRLRQAIENLVGNAVKHTPDDSDIEIVVDATEQVGVLSVIDHGPGVAEDQREAIFERFTQLHRVSGHPGLGLGLYIVKTIAESHRGSVRVEQADGGGAKFVLEVPLAPRAQRIEADEPQEPEASRA